MSQPADLRIHIRLHSQYRALDLSGGLPNHIIFGFCRRWKEDLDPRTIILDTSGSILDVPYAIANGLLEIEGAAETQDAVRAFSAEPGPRRYFAIPPVKRVKCRGNRNEDFEVFSYEVEVGNEMAGLLKLGTKYDIRIADKGLGIRWWRYLDAGEVLPEIGIPATGETEATKLICMNKPWGHAMFTVVESVQFPPKLDVRLRLRSRPEPSESGKDDISQGRAYILEASITNTSPSRALCIQSRGHQRFLNPWGLIQPISDIAHWPRLLSTAEIPRFSLKISSINGETTTVVYRHKPPICAGLLAGGRNIDRRPIRSQFTTLFPGEPVVMEVDLGAFMHQLVDNLGWKDGMYKTEIDDSQGSWWCWGSVDEVFRDAELGQKEKIPQDLYDLQRVPVRFTSEDEVVVEIVDGQVVGEVE